MQKQHLSPSVMMSSRMLPFSCGEWYPGEFEGDIHFSSLEAFKETMSEISAKISKFGNVKIPFYIGSLEQSDNEYVLQPYVYSMETVTHLRYKMIRSEDETPRGVLYLHVENDDANEAKYDMWLMESYYRSLSFRNMFSFIDNGKFMWVFFTDVVDALYTATKLDMLDFLMGTKSPNTPIYRASRHWLCDRQIFRLISKF